MNNTERDAFVAAEIAAILRELETAKRMTLSALAERDALRARVGELEWEKEQARRRASLTPKAMGRTI